MRKFKKWHSYYSPPLHFKKGHFIRKKGPKVPRLFLGGVHILFIAVTILLIVHFIFFITFYIKDWSVAKNGSCDLFSTLEILSGKQITWPLEVCFPENGKFKKAFCYIHLTNWLVSRFLHYKFLFSRSHLVRKIENLVTDLPPRLCLRWQNCHLILIFQTQRLLENRKIIVSKPFVHTKFDKFI